MKKNKRYWYKFQICETSYIELSQEQYDNSKHVWINGINEYGKEIIVKNDKGNFMIIAPESYFEKEEINEE